jgi:hypothetical protein
MKTSIEDKCMSKERNLGNKKLPDGPQDEYDRRTHTSIPHQTRRNPIPTHCMLPPHPNTHSHANASTSFLHVCIMINFLAFLKLPHNKR